VDTTDPPGREIPVPSREGATPNLFVAADGSTYLSWIEYLDDSTDALQFSQLESAGWTAPVTIAQGSDWFVNWADFPALAASAEQPEHLAAHWLQKRAAGTYDYDIHLSQSTDGGRTWSPSFVPHRDSVAAEHGFVSLLPLPNGRIFASWLDGRHTKSAPAGTTDHADHGSGGQPMTLRTAEFDSQGNLFAEAELDDRVCDCCQTSAALTTAGPVVVYRDRSTDEVRDIAIVRRVDGRWTAPQLLNVDNWRIAGCPVNGPAIAARGDTVAVAWYTEADTLPRVQLTFSLDGGANFGPPIRIDDGHPLGRVDVVLSPGATAMVTWIEAAGDRGTVRLAKATPQGRTGESLLLTPVELSRRSGFPILQQRQDRLVLAWTAVDSATTRIRTREYFAN
jgi:hypothetical protein